MNFFFNLFTSSKNMYIFRSNAMEKNKNVQPKMYKVQKHFSYRSLFIRVQKPPENGSAVDFLTPPRLLSDSENRQPVLRPSNSQFLHFIRSRPQTMTSYLPTIKLSIIQLCIRKKSALRSCLKSESFVLRTPLYSILGYECFW